VLYQRITSQIWAAQQLTRGQRKTAIQWHRNYQLGFVPPMARRCRLHQPPTSSAHEREKPAHADGLVESPQVQPLPPSRRGGLQNQRCGKQGSETRWHRGFPSLAQPLPAQFPMPARNNKKDRRAEPNVAGFEIVAVLFCSEISVNPSPSIWARRARLVPPRCLYSAPDGGMVPPARVHVPCRQHRFHEEPLDHGTASDRHVGNREQQPSSVSLPFLSGKAIVRKFIHRCAIQETD